ncbi:related to phytochrome [Rhynchosporium secalis]|uniref:Related to phytochrome n=1 Tax=Rhynchosporium secalis TaxID=38038 RepID=A0A1E1MA87_RHYSE|nr:related to phytochrome [Rhynchosporium secalis]
MPSTSFGIRRVFPILIKAPDSTAESALDALGLSVYQPTPATDNEGSDQEKPPVPKSLVRIPPPKEPDLELSNDATPTGERLVQTSNDQILTDSAPQVVTSEEPGERTSTSERFVSKTYSFVTAGHKTAPSARAANKVQNTVKVYRCEDEPIHMPGAIQRFGALIAIREDEAGYFVVRIVSENTEDITGLEPEQLFDLRCFTDLLFTNDKKDFLSRVRNMQTQRFGLTVVPDVFSLSLTSLRGAPMACYIAMHYNPESDVIICEFEPKGDLFDPQHPSDTGLPDKPIQVTDNQPSEEEVRLSTTCLSQPLRAVQVARETGCYMGPMELFNVLCEIQGQLSSASTLPELLDIIVGLVYQLTSFHRALVYQFDETTAGTVVSEIVDSRASTDIYRGLKFPSSDIPKQARDLYMINKIRVLYDRDEPSARLICRSIEDAATPLDLRHSYLRAMSPIHIKYLENLGVRATMSISLTVDNKLWGLVSCHGYGSGKRVPLPVRELCRALGDLASTNIEKIIYASRIKARKPLTTYPQQRAPSAYIAASSGELLNMFGADFGFLAIKGEARTIGRLFAYNEAIVLLQYIRSRSFTNTYASECITRDLPEIDFSPGFKMISGILVIPLALSGSDFLIFFRKGQTEEVKWAGNPHEKKKIVGNYLEPRSSFRRWSERVVGRSRKWTEDEVDSAAVLSTLYGRFIEVWRQKEAIVQRNRLTRVLIRNTGHEVRTPLNSIINYLEVALEEDLDEGARQHLQRSLQASKSLVFQVNDLLSLTEAEDSEFNNHEENIDLRSMLQEVMDSYRDRSLRPGLQIELRDDFNVPTMVRCDPSMLRSVISNLLANAIQHSGASHVSIELDQIVSSDTNNLVEISFRDNGCGLSEQGLDCLFQDFEQVLDDDDDQSDTQGNTGVYETVGKDHTGPITLGLGLAMTARFVRLNAGQIAIDSELGKGTRVSIKIPFRLAHPEKARDTRSQSVYSLPTPPMLTHDVMSSSVISNISAGTPRPSSGQGPGPGTFERSFSESTLSNRLGMTREKLQMTPGPESLASIAHALSMSRRPSFDPPTRRFPFPSSNTNCTKVNILVAEDNPLNSRLLETRLTKRGHTVKVTVDGQACADAYMKTPAAFDVILMDIQMPLVDGNGSTRLIRTFEKKESPTLSKLAKSHGRIPIIAVSASLSESCCMEYMNNGFDGWILKPIDFSRLLAIIAAIEDEEKRNSMMYGSVKWTDGGWFQFKHDTPTQAEHSFERLDKIPEVCQHESKAPEELENKRRNFIEEPRETTEESQDINEAPR